MATGASRFMQCCCRLRNEPRSVDPIKRPEKYSNKFSQNLLILQLWLGSVFGSFRIAQERPPPTLKRVAWVGEYGTVKQVLDAVLMYEHRESVLERECHNDMVHSAVGKMTTNVGSMGQLVVKSVVKIVQFSAFLTAATSLTCPAAILYHPRHWCNSLLRAQPIHI